MADSQLDDDAAATVTADDVWFGGDVICLLLAVVLVVVSKLVFGRKNNKRNLLGSKERELLGQRAGITYSVCKLSTTIIFFLF